MAAYDLARHGEFLSGREKGEEVYRSLAAWLDGLPAGEEAVLDLAGVVMVNTSFGDETIGRVLDESRAGRFGGRRIRVAGATNRAVESAVRRIEEIRGLSAA